MIATLILAALLAVLSAFYIRSRRVCRIQSETLLRQSRDLAVLRRAVDLQHAAEVADSLRAEAHRARRAVDGDEVLSAMLDEVLSANLAESMTPALRWRVHPQNPQLN